VSEEHSTVCSHVIRSVVLARAPCETGKWGYLCLPSRIQNSTGNRINHLLKIIDDCFSCLNLGYFQKDFCKPLHRGNKSQSLCLFTITPSLLAGEFAENRTPVRFLIMLCVDFVEWAEVGLVDVGLGARLHLDAVVAAPLPGFFRDGLFPISGVWQGG
jgi:hypothetical protein